MGGSQGGVKCSGKSRNTMYWVIVVAMLILQWNARSLIANGQDFKKFIYSQKEKPDLLCIQESWLKPSLDFRINGYVAIRQDRKDGAGGGCVTFVKEGIPYRNIDIGNELECVVIEVWAERKNLVVINFYNPCRKLELSRLEDIEGLNRGSIVWCGDFNAHNTLWGSDKTDYNGQVVEELLDGKHLVCINDGRNTRIDVNTGKESVIDLTLVTNTLARLCEWDVYQEGTIGSDHYPIYSKINIVMVHNTENTGGKWIFGKANWGNFMTESGKHLQQISDNMSIEMSNCKILQGIMAAAISCIPKSIGRTKRKLVP
ncbi:hypothetical protein ANANG_G00286560 [Anguilla anguilla]|uniref:Endonuclease/exonuclease/phosphatase domain-containing protein n=1 Tax=Anguilla anguilla TaxID=7936 RepID=A0A9D3LP21_ANGAN|nr:hypothetical protein ANANG_G00286560 [Anguilla anguilla]